MQAREIYSKHDELQRFREGGGGQTFDLVNRDQRRNSRGLIARMPGELARSHC